MQANSRTKDLRDHRSLLRQEHQRQDRYRHEFNAFWPRRRFAGFEQASGCVRVVVQKHIEKHTGSIEVRQAEGLMQRPEWVVVLARMKPNLPKRPADRGKAAVRTLKVAAIGRDLNDLILCTHEFTGFFGNPQIGNFPR